MKWVMWAGIMGLFMAGVTVTWALTLSGGLPAAVYLYEGGRLLALLGFVILCFQYLWVSKIRFVEVGIAAGRLLTLHRRCGVFAMALLALHPMAIIVSERLQGYSAPMGPLKTMGVIALVLLLGAGGAALFSRKLHLPYRTWKGIHRLAYGVFPLAFAHSFLLGATLQKMAVKAVWTVLALIYLVHLLQRVLRRSPQRRLRAEGITKKVK
ncbi:MAG: ferric reductase-like transmembrane domain-containing protein [Deltaproteobacteria bacterium]|nr:ferric reductase-like transmembrane domain-containing protein [Deltaproteobacteria bacterium]